MMAILQMTVSNAIAWVKYFKFFNWNVTDVCSEGFIQLMINQHWFRQYGMALNKGQAIVFAPKCSINYKSTLMQVMTWCWTAAGHYLNQCWPYLLMAMSITRCQIFTLLTGIILYVCTANERWHYNVMSSLTGWAQTQNDPCAQWKSDLNLIIKSPRVNGGLIVFGPFAPPPPSPLLPFCQHFSTVREKLFGTHLGDLGSRSLNYRSGTQFTIKWEPLIQSLQNLIGISPSSCITPD